MTEIEMLFSHYGARAGFYIMIAEARRLIMGAAKRLLAASILLVELLQELPN
jgi:hypothetical protein